MLCKKSNGKFKQEQLTVSCFFPLKRARKIGLACPPAGTQHNKLCASVAIAKIIAPHSLPNQGQKQVILSLWVGGKKQHDFLSFSALRILTNVIQ